MRTFQVGFFITLFLCFTCTQIYAQTSNDITIYSSNKELVETFKWATEKALTFVQTGKTGPINVSERNKNTTDLNKYIPSYWAGYPLRTAFYSRDFCHQLVGAHLLGLENENYSMLKAFASSADDSKKWYPLWAINFDGTPYNLDYQNDANFVREVPAVFELVEKTYQLNLWTGNESIIKDEDIWLFCQKAVSDFVALHDTNFPNGIAEGTGKGIFQGTATYNEQHDVPLLEAGDGIASQYKAFVAFAKMAKVHGEKKISEAYFTKAMKLKEYFNTEWGVKNTNLYNRGFSMSHKPVTGWGKENSWFIPMKGITNSGSERHNAYLHFIDEKLDSKEDIPDNIEAISYVPEVFFIHHKNETAWKWMKHIISEINTEHVQSSLTGTNGNYPEVSFVLISNVIENLLGVQPNAAKSEIITLSHLPSEIKFLGARNIKIGQSKVELKHTSTNTSILNYTQGKEELMWEARFAGKFEKLYLNGKEVVCENSSDNGLEYSYLEVVLKPGNSVEVSIEK
jgi:hypothetical protein